MVVGGGEVALRKAASLLESGAVVTVVSPRVTPALATMVRRGRITHVKRRYRRGDMDGCVLVYSATGGSALNRKLAAEAQERRILLNVADAPSLCSFIAPAVVRRGALQIAISTGGDSPAFAGRVRRELEAQYGPEHALAVEILGAARRFLRTKIAAPAQRARRLAALANASLTEALHAGDLAGVERLLNNLLGTGIGLEDLGIDPAVIKPARRRAALS